MCCLLKGPVSFGGDSGGRVGGGAKGKGKAVLQEGITNRNRELDAPKRLA